MTVLTNAGTPAYLTGAGTQDVVAFGETGTNSDFIMVTFRNQTGGSTTLKIYVNQPITIGEHFDFSLGAGETAVFEEYIGVGNTVYAEAGVSNTITYMRSRVKNT